MSLLEYNFCNSSVSHKDLKKIYTKLFSKIIDINNKLATGDLYASPYAALNLSRDVSLIANTQELLEVIKKTKPALLILIAIGGSSLGALAILQALGNKTGNIQFYCADTLDNDLVADILAHMQKKLEGGEVVILNIITKSGTTTETIVNSTLFFELLKKYKPENYQDFIIITTQEDSPLGAIAKKHNFYLLDIAKNIGGRYSVLSAVGLFPLGLLGINISNLQKGAQRGRELYLSTNFAVNHAATSAAIIYLLYHMGKNIFDMFMFSPDLAQLGAWSRQLMGESLGKTTIVDDTVKHVGITPTVSLGTSDLHSVLQLYLAGPYDKFTQFVSFADESSSLIVPSNIFSQVIPDVKYKSVTSIKKNILQAVQHAYKQEKRPYVSLVLKNKTEQALGEYIMFKLCETIYLAHLLDINPFDQPAVETYKNQTRILLQK